LGGGEVREPLYPLYRLERREDATVMFVETLEMLQHSTRLLPERKSQATITFSNENLRTRMYGIKFTCFTEFRRQDAYRCIRLRGLEFDSGARGANSSWGSW
jgi:hypothetical protein